MDSLGLSDFVILLYMRLAFYKELPTEQKNPHSARLDELSALQIVQLMNRDDARVLKAVRQAAPVIARASDLILASWKKGGRLILVGAGTSGRLAVIEAAECPPTFNTPATQVQAIMAGGRTAVFQSQEGSEDSKNSARQAMKQLVRQEDVVLGIAASGVTPFVRAALQEARRLSALPLLLTCNPGLRHSRLARLVIPLDTGPELLTGSTRLKAGTACKMVLNMLTTASLVRQGKTYGNRMVDLQPKSRKLIARSLGLIAEIGRVNPRQAQRLLRQSGRQAKTAIVMARMGCSAQEARSRLQAVDGFLRKVIG